MDFKALGLRAGLEIHQQLKTKEKLFCRCPVEMRDVESSSYSFFRYLHATRSELGEIDVAAEEETSVRRKFQYLAYDTTCLVEDDEEPPKEIDREALEIALMIARMMKMHVVDQIHVMRKVVVDGSNTTGFQRTALIALDGFIEVEGKKISIPTLCLEEDAAQKVDENIYSLDRLGIPLVEIATAPEMETPEEVRKVAEKIGEILRSTGRVRRGLGTIRQDVNVSISEGARVEIKGVQELELLDKIVEFEVKRQLELLKIRDELRRRGASIGDLREVTEIFRETKSKILRRKIEGGGVVLAVLLKGFSGILGRELLPGLRFGTEIADRVRRRGAGGCFHTDELPAYGITEEEVRRLREFMGAEEEDAILLIAEEREIAERAMEAAIKRCMEAFEGVPEETRRAMEDGTTRYMRPLPGAARMYPETDVPPVEITEEMLQKIGIPELISEARERFIREYGLNEEMARKIANSDNRFLFERIVKELGVSPQIVVRVLEEIIPQIRREGAKTENLKEEHFMSFFMALREGKFAKEASDEILKFWCEAPEKKIDEILEMMGISGTGVGELRDFIRELLRKKADLIKERGERAFSPLMGEVMKRFRGRVDGKLVSEILMEEMRSFMESGDS
ncbi:MAG: glutamyl-tRNA(Gln) amidotransferase subunit [Archaeoglobi archaeon]|nr:glutamyl-tRNA(Gln) amidotransferase subunit [Archaeoglobi archaeon]